MNTGNRYEIPQEMREMAEKSVDQARKAIGGILTAVHKAVDTVEGSTSSLQANASDATRKTLAYTEQNITSVFEFATKLVHAKDVQEAMQLQSEFARTQMATVQGQMKDFGEMAQSAARSATSQATAAAQDATNAARSATEQAASYAQRTTE